MYTEIVSGMLCVLIYRKQDLESHERSGNEDSGDLSEEEEEEEVRTAWSDLAPSQWDGLSFDRLSSKINSTGIYS